jgi:hypothetical protein
MGKLKDKIKGVSEKIDRGPYIEWLPNPFTFRPMEPPPEMEQELIRDRVAANLCARDGGTFSKKKDGRITCDGCGLHLNDEVRERLGYRKWWQI